MDTTVNILEGYVLESQFAAGARISPRTSARYRNQPDGLPFLEFGGKIYIPLEGAREWVQSRVKHPNARRRAA